MSNPRTPPENLVAERALLGAFLLSTEAVTEARRVVMPADFYSPNHGQICHLVYEMHGRGDPIDPLTVADELLKCEWLDRIGGPAELVTLLANCPSTSGAPKYARMIAEASQLRAIMHACADVIEMGYGKENPGDVIDFLQARLAAVDLSLGAVPDKLYRLDDFLEAFDEEGRPPWVIPGIIRAGWRVLLVAAEGVGKSVLFRQIAIAAAQGIHPLTFDPMPGEPPVTLIVDLENPEDAIVDVCEPIRDEALGRARENYNPDRAWLWHQPQGIDLRSRAGKSKLEAVIAHVRPEVVCLGPLYKAYRTAPHESDEQAAGDVQSVLDDLRIRYKFGVLIEHHAPKGPKGSRELTPYGTSLWLRWSEIGMTMTPAGEDPEDMTLMRLGRFRGDRVEHTWPNRILRSKPWPFEGQWDVGTTQQPPEEMEQF
ncbi:MAG TPA: DnaB-like helicase N-terminal domain-containing protein [Acidimicrobiales bacterium]|nr:DnaB-like helicase N-terminal domain-containing protein [Acidimicrobiales bacterium]